MSRNSDEARPNKTGQLFLATVHGLVFGVPAVVSGSVYLLALAALYPLGLLGRYLRGCAKGKRAGPASTSGIPNPFGQ